ncbi:MAG: UDP-N-acetylglucosamine--N-acetylmuramyl-(pentapeptide) pyrophosphoryl-undecaprenol N-acetylglucosamine transferase [Lentisphaerae bacterium]|nr:UDP-N-acetylglucosamine--N-acetylmuramyl-(pentapeptide) pyrophosphoryl-undecaprenol N-acetylglucosamine transferase [Lentisphaerota bacterium]
MKIGIACGGTGGHIFPGLATATALRQQGHEVVLWLTGKDIEQTALAGWDGPVERVSFGGLAPLLSWRHLVVVWQLGQAVRRCRAALRRQRVQVLLAMGSYASVAPVWAARSLRIPVVLHEANVIPGRAVRWLSRWAAAVAIGFAETRSHLHHPRLVLTGMPSRPPDSQAPGEGAVPWHQLAADCFTVLVMGGSRGARHLNACASVAMANLHRQGHKVQVIHLSGLAEEQAIRAYYLQAGVRHLVCGFLHDMPQAYRRAALAVCRAGAATCAELAAYAVPALLVPYPRATHQHQLANARAVAAAGAADLRLEAELDSAWLTNYLARQLAEADRLAGMRQAARRRHQGQAAESLAALVLAVGNGR